MLTGGAKLRSSLANERRAPQPGDAEPGCFPDVAILARRVQRAPLLCQGTACSGYLDAAAWEKFGSREHPTPSLNLAEQTRKAAPDLAFHEKPLVTAVTGLSSHRRGHWFDPSIARTTESRARSRFLVPQAPPTAGPEASLRALGRGACAAEGDDVCGGLLDHHEDRGRR